jgi:HEAT repeat protein
MTPMVEGQFQIPDEHPVLGGPIFVVLHYRSVAEYPITFALGNSRAEGIRFRALGPGVTALNPYNEMGGLEEVIRLAPGEAGQKDVLLNRYLRFTAPGQYIIDAELDFTVRDEQSTIRGTEPIRDRLTLSLPEDPERLSAVLASLERELTEDSAAGSTATLHILAELRTPNALAILVRALTAPEPELAEEAIRAMGRSGLPEARLALEQFLSATPSAHLRGIALEEIANLQ